MSIADPYIFAKKSPLPDFIFTGGQSARLETPYKKPNHGAPSDYPAFSRPIGYPTYLYIASSFVLVGTVISAIVGYVAPGLFTGAALPVFATLWWLLYRLIRYHDEQRPR